MDPTDSDCIATDRCGCARGTAGFDLLALHTRISVALEAFGEIKT